MFPKDQLSVFVAMLMTDYRVVAPKWRDDELLFDRIASPDQIVLDYRNTAKPPKGVFFPQTETLIRFGVERGRFNQVEAVPLDRTPTILLGVRPCDVRSYLMLDKVFAQGQYLDPYYRARRENTVIVGLACDHPRRTCFCHAVGGDPYDTTGSDVLLYEAADAYLAEAISARGEALLEGLSPGEADEAHRRAAVEIEAGAKLRLVGIAPLAGIEDRLSSLFDSPVWQEVSEKCLACGTCTYACPGCHCFNIEDSRLAHGGERLRSWDSCMYPTFTIHASGHNPRPDQAARWRQRMMHKFEYLSRNVREYGCFGCGRCILACPVRLDVREVLGRVRQELNAQVVEQE